MSLKTLAISLTSLAITLSVIFSLPATQSINGIFFASFLLLVSLIVWIIVLANWLRKP